MRILCVVRYLVVPRWCSQEIWFCRKLKRWDAITRRTLYLHDWLVLMLGIHTKKALASISAGSIAMCNKSVKKNEREQKTGRIALSIVDNRTSSSEKDSGWKKVTFIVVCMPLMQTPLCQSIYHEQVPWQCWYNQPTHRVYLIKQCIMDTFTSNLRHL